MNTLISQAHVIDPASGWDSITDVAISDGKVLAIGELPSSFKADVAIDARGLHLLPGLVDLRARMREPGHEHAGMLASETIAAAAGGVTTLVCPPDTDPVLDEPGLIEMLRQRAARLHGVRVLPLGALTMGLRGEQLTEMAELVHAGCVGLSQANTSLPSHTVLLRAMQYAATFDLTVFLQAQDAALSKGGVAASGAIAMRMGLPSVSVAAESIALYAMFELMRASGARIHVCGVSSARGVELLRAAKAEGLRVTADVSVHNLHLTDADIGHFDSRMRLDPVVRQQRDREALRSALADGTIDALVSDHTPVLADEKHVPFSEATPGASAIELLLSLCLKWALADGVPLTTALSRITHGAANVLGELKPRLAGQLAAGGRADLCLVDMTKTWAADASTLVSQSKFTPFSADLTGTALPARVVGTWVAGQRVFQRT